MEDEERRDDGPTGYPSEWTDEELARELARRRPEKYADAYREVFGIGASSEETEGD